MSATPTNTSARVRCPECGHRWPLPYPIEPTPAMLECRECGATNGEFAGLDFTSAATVDVAMAVLGLNNALYELRRFEDALRATAKEKP